MKMMTTPNPQSGACMSHGHGEKTAEEIMDDGSMDDTTVDGSNDDEND